MKLRAILFFNLCFLFSFRSLAAPIGSSVTADRFHQIFTTAAYSTALGGAIGTAALVFTPKPAENLRFIAFGASIGFLSGILLGGYLAFVPSFGAKSKASYGGRGGNVAFDPDITTIQTHFGADGSLEQVALYLPAWKF